MQEFHDRHQKTRQFFLQRFDQVKSRMLTDRPLEREPQALLIGSYFTQEYALESAALFNPSMVWHPDQSDLPEGSRRFILSLRATGEGHISSITFRGGIVDADHQIHMDEPTRLSRPPNLVPNALYDKLLFLRKLIELGINGPFDRPGDRHARRPVHPRRAGDGRSRNVLRQNRPRQHEFEPIAQGMIMLARANYEIRFDPELRRLGADHLPVVADRDQRHRGRPVRPLRR